MRKRGKQDEPENVSTVQSRKVRVNDLATVLALVALWKITDGQGDVRRVLCDQVARSGVVGNSSSKETEAAANLGDLDLDRECTNHEEHESEHQEEEQGGERYTRAQRREEHDEGEYEPGSEEEANGILEVTRFGLCGRVSVDNASARDENQGVRDPESTVGRESSGAEGVTASKLPHASEELGDSTTSDGHTKDNLGLDDMASLDVNEGKDKSG
jgi:hypothetical protein